MRSALPEPASPAAIAAVVVPSSRRAVLEIDTVTLDDLRLIVDRWGALRRLSVMALFGPLWLMRWTDGLVGLMLLVSFQVLNVVLFFMPSATMRAVAGAHGCGPELVRQLARASRHAYLAGFVDDDGEFQRILRTGTDHTAGCRQGCDRCTCFAE